MRKIVPIAFTTSFAFHSLANANFYVGASLNVNQNDYTIKSYSLITNNDQDVLNPISITEIPISQGGTGGATGLLLNGVPITNLLSIVNNIPVFNVLPNGQDVQIFNNDYNANDRVYQNTFQTANRETFVKGVENIIGQIVSSMNNITNFNIINNFFYYPLTLINDATGGGHFQVSTNFLSQYNTLNPNDIDNIGYGYVTYRLIQTLMRQNGGYIDDSLYHYFNYTTDPLTNVITITGVTQGFREAMYQMYAYATQVVNTSFIGVDAPANFLGDVERLVLVDPKYTYGVSLLGGYNKGFLDNRLFVAPEVSIDIGFSDKLTKGSTFLKTRSLAAYNALVRGGINIDKSKSMYLLTGIQYRKMHLDYSNFVDESVNMTSFLLGTGIEYRVKPNFGIFLEYMTAIAKNKTVDMVNPNNNDKFGTLNDIDIGVQTLKIGVRYYIDVRSYRRR